MENNLLNSLLDASNVEDKSSSLLASKSEFDCTVEGKYLYCLEVRAQIEGIEL